MDVIKNKWIEKVRKKKDPETAPSYAAIRVDEMDESTPRKCHTNAARARYKHTLRGVRK
jgi:hypothetical protein